jgi:MFS transporter, ACS family, allantoate permease
VTPLLSHMFAKMTNRDDTDTPQYTEEQYRQLKRKIDRYLLPLMWLCYGIQQTDKTSIGTQATFGLRTDTRLVGQQYSWLSTAFYLTYLVCTVLQ